MAGFDILPEPGRLKGAHAVEHGNPDTDLPNGPPRERPGAQRPGVNRHCLVTPHLPTVAGHFTRHHLAVDAQAPE